MKNSSSTPLCKACGLCCNGVLFDTVRLQTADSPEELKSLGMHIKHKKKYDFFYQPCSFFRNNCCFIYSQRPERCRLFECQQLKNLASGKITEIEGLETITQALSKVANLKKLLRLSGSLNRKKSLSQQYEKVIAEPVHDSLGVKAIEERLKLVQAFTDLKEFLTQEFYASPLPK